MQARSEAGAGRMGGCGRGVAAGARQGAAGFAGTSAASRRHTGADAERLPSRVHSHDGPRAVRGAHGWSFGPSALRRHGCWAPALSRAEAFPIMKCYAKKPALLASAGWCSRPSGLLYTLRIGRRTLHNIYVIGPETRAPPPATAPRRRENDDARLGCADSFGVPARFALDLSACAKRARNEPCGAAQMPHFLFCLSSMQVKSGCVA